MNSISPNKPRKDNEFKQSPIGKIPEDWEVVKLGDVFSVETGTTPSTKREEYWENGRINWLTPTDLSKLNGKIHISGSERKITEKALKDYNLTLLPKGSIIVSTRAPVGYVAVLDVDATFNQGCKGLIPKSSEINTKFYCYYLLAIKQRLEQLSGGSTFKELSKNALENLLIPLPPLPEQQKIAEILSTVDNAIQKVDEAIAKTERLKKGLMQELLTKGTILGFMFDTTVFGDILDNKINIEKFPKYDRYYVTHVQYDEILGTPNETVRKRVLEIFQKIPKKEIPTESFVVGLKYSRVGKAKLGGGVLLEAIREGNLKHTRDALIGETAIKNGLILVTNDKRLLNKVRDLGGQAITLGDFLKGKYREFKESEVGKIPREWEVLRLGDVAEIRSNKTINGIEKVAFIPMELIPNSGIYAKFEIRKREDVKSFTYCEKGDLLLAKITPSLENGKQGIVPDDALNGFALATTEVFPISCRNIDRLFLFYVLKFQKFRNKIIASMIGTTGRQRASKESLKNLQIPLPPLPEQRKIAEILSTVDNAIQKVDEAIAKTEGLKKGLMQELLTKGIGHKEFKDTEI
ncbi:MAG TPA: hypothetical protein ENI49_05645, partial [Thermoplasmatales archaeon]|nr:hypothetical protein [Thermoplasmatales archaeon]